MTVLLVDGVGNGVKYERQRDVLLITLKPAGVVFEKTSEIIDGLEVYRQRDAGAPDVRHINEHLIERKTG